jgi:hypothetical protein
MRPWSVVVFGVAAAATVTGCGAHGQAGGPLQDPRDATNASSGSVPSPLGTRVSTGMVFLKNRSSEPARLQDIRLVSRQNGLAVLGAYVVPWPPGAQIGLLRKYTPSSGKPLAGYVIPPHKTANVVLGVTQTQPGMRGFRAVFIRYSLGGHGFAAHFNLALRLCAPPLTAETCPSPRPRLDHTTP